MKKPNGNQIEHQRRLTVITCSTPDCNKPHHAKGLCPTCYKARQRRDKKRDTYGTQPGTPSAPGAVQYITPTPKVERHNIIKEFLIESKEYYFDTDVTWKETTKGGRPTGKYSHMFIRDAVGYPYDQTMKGKKPPLSVIKGGHKDNRKIEVFINEGAGIKSDEHLDNLLQRIKATLETDMDTTLSGPHDRTFTDTGEPITDYTTPCPMAKKFGEANPDKIPFKPDKKKGEAYEPMKIDGSHPKAWEGHNKQQAYDQKAIIEDAGVIDVTDEREAEKVARAVSTLEQTKEGVAAIMAATDIMIPTLKGVSGEITQDFHEGTMLVLKTNREDHDNIMEEVKAVKAGTMGLERAVEGLIEHNVRIGHIQEDLAMRPDLMVHPVNVDGSQLLELKTELKREKSKREQLEERLENLEGKSMWDILIDYLKGGNR